MELIEPTPRTRVRQHAERGRYDRQTVHRIIDAAMICHVGIVDDAQPFVLPMVHARIEDVLYLHGAYGSRLLDALRHGARACVTFTLLDGLVLARSALHHSLNYRSVVVLGEGREVTDAAEKWRAFEAIVEHAVPGRWTEIRPPSDEEARATAVVAIEIREASAKIRTGGVKESVRDRDPQVWAGQVTLATFALGLVGEPELAATALPPPSVRALLTRRLDARRNAGNGA
ncbi:MAG: pyridoxamine 5'-phosphate oxidase family protein [Planctomycetes bacterium]|nr:pyridoxamine 5'-phosphate oxidase family protein [Planctomycetota bacterium]